MQTNKIVPIIPQDTKKSIYVLCATLKVGSFKNLLYPKPFPNNNTTGSEKNMFK